MFGQVQNLRDQFTLANTHLYLSQPTIDPFVFFASNVPIRSELSILDESSIDKIIEPLNKAINTFGVKIVSPFRTLLLRMIQSNIGFTTLHVYFLKICKIFSLPSEALPIIEYPGLFKNLKRKEQIEFLLTSCEIYIDLLKYDQAYEVIVKAAKLDTRSDELLVAVYKKLIVLSIYAGKTFAQFNQGINKLCARIQVKLNQREMGERQFQKKPKSKPIDYQLFSFFLYLKDWRQLNQKQTLMMSSEKLLDVFNASRYGHLGRYIESDVKGLNWRIKADSVKNIEVGEVDVIKGVNRSKQIYKYDSQQKIMYFNHKICDQNKLNELITKAFLMQNEVNNCKIQKKEEITRSGVGNSLFGGLLSSMGKKKSRGFKEYDDDDQ